MSDLGFRTTTIFGSLFSPSESSSSASSAKTSRLEPQLPVNEAGPAPPAPASSQGRLHGRTLSNGKIIEEILSPTEEKPASNSGRLGPVLRSSDGKRIDKPLWVDNNIIQALLVADLCHWHYLRADCKMEGKSCKYNHKFPKPLGSKQFDALWSLSRKNACRRDKKGKICEDDQCIYGHTQG